MYFYQFLSSCDLPDNLVRINLNDWKANICHYNCCADQKRARIAWGAFGAQSIGIQISGCTNTRRKRRLGYPSFLAPAKCQPATKNWGRKKGAQRASESKKRERSHTKRCAVFWRSAPNRTAIGTPGRRVSIVVLRFWAVWTCCVESICLVHLVFLVEIRGVVAMWVSVWDREVFV